MVNFECPRCGHCCPDVSLIDEGKKAEPQEPLVLPEKTYEFVPTPKPLAWHHPGCEGECIACLIERTVQESYGSQGLGYLQRHLAARPQAREPLTDEEIDQLVADALKPGQGHSLRDWVRRIETAHGITGETK
jgi:hypothetical protein